MVQGLLEEVDI